MTEFLAHAVGDYVVQSDWMAAEKTNRHGPALLHAATYAACFLPLTRRWQPLLVIGGTHFVIDRWRLAKHVGWLKNQAAPKPYRPPHTPTGYGPDKPDWMAVWLLIITDNTTHLLINRWALKRWRKLTKHPHPRWSMPRDSRKRAEVAAEQAIARYGTAEAAREATGIPLGVLEAAEARINEAVST